MADDYTPTLEEVRAEDEAARTPHAPWPGPWPSWDWRCRICSEPLRNHPGLIRRAIQRWSSR